VYISLIDIVTSIALKSVKFSDFDLESTLHTTAIQTYYNL